MPIINERLKTDAVGEMGQLGTATKFGGGGGGGGSVTPASVLSAMEGMDLSQQADARAAIGATDTTTGLADSIKQALLNCFDHVAWTDEHGQDYVDALEAALYPLDHITAVYTQGGTVYDTDSLDSLKTDLVVTAVYEGGNTATVAAENYTLSGTLTEGTSTVTVTYIGKTTTFTVTVLALPSGYTRYGWIHAKTTANRPPAALIKLPTQADLNVLSMNLEFSVVSFPSSNVAVLGTRASSNVLTSYSFYIGSDGESDEICGAIRGQWYQFNAPSVSVGTRNALIFDNPSQSPCVVKVNTDEKSVSWTSSVTINGGLVMFTNPQIGSTSDWSVASIVKIGKIDLYDAAGNLVSSCVPCKNSSNVIGMYDSVTNAFCTTSTPSYATIGNSSCIYELGNWS